jgi:hypothetical protein
MIITHASYRHVLVSRLWLVTCYDLGQGNLLLANSGRSREGLEGRWFVTGQHS